MAMCGGRTAVRPADAETQAICDKIRAEVEKQANNGDAFDCFTAISVSTQVVAGMNYFVKVRTGENSFIHITVFQDLSGKLTLTGFRFGDSATCGGITAVRPADAKTQDICDKIRTEVEKQANNGDAFDCFTAISVSTQVVAGMNYFVKVRTGENSFIHITVFQDLSGKLTLTGFRFGDSATCGGITAVRPADAKTQDICDKIRAEVEKRANNGDAFDCFMAISVSTQVVAGMNYFVKVRTGENSFIYITVFQDLSGKLTLSGFRFGDSATDEL